MTVDLRTTAAAETRGPLEVASRAARLTRTHLLAARVADASGFRHHGLWCMYSGSRRKAPRLLFAAVDDLERQDGARRDRATSEVLELCRYLARMQDRVAPV